MGGDVGVLLKSAAFWLKVRVPWRYSTCFSFRQGLIWVGLDSGKGGGGAWIVSSILAKRQSALEVQYFFISFRQGLVWVGLDSRNLGRGWGGGGCHRSSLQHSG